MKLFLYDREGTPHQVLNSHLHWQSSEGSEGIVLHLKFVVIHEGTEGSDLCPSPENKFTKMKENFIGIECILLV